MALSLALVLALVAWVGSPAVAVGASAQGVDVSAETSRVTAAPSGPLRTIDGCHGGRILAPLVPILSAHPEREPAHRIGWLRGTHRRDLCRGTVVIVHERERIRGRAWVLVEPIEGPGPGWIDESFLGSFFPRWKCDWRFEDEALERCLRA